VIGVSWFWSVSGDNELLIIKQLLFSHVNFKSVKRLINLNVKSIFQMIFAILRTVELMLMAFGWKCENETLPWLAHKNFHLQIEFIAYLICMAFAEYFDVFDYDDGDERFQRSLNCEKPFNFSRMSRTSYFDSFSFPFLKSGTLSASISQKL
jgi:hypothetical protein